MRGADRPRDNLLVASIVILALFFAENAFFHAFSVSGARPELLLVATIFFGFYYGGMGGLWAGLLSGSLKDLFSVSPFGLNMFLFSALGICSGLLRRKLSRENPISQFAFSFLAAYLLSAAHFLVIKNTIAPQAGTTFWKIVLVKAVYTAALSPFLFFAFRKIFNPENS